MKLNTLTVLLVATALALAAQEKGDDLTSVYRTNQVELQDKEGQIVFWIDGWARVHSPDLLLWQQEYNSWIQQSFGSSIVSFLGGLSAPEGIELVSPQPPGRRGIKETGVFAVPVRIQENGVLTRDTLSLMFFELGIQWNYLAHDLSHDCEAAGKPWAAINCRDYRVDWRTSSDELRAAAPDDRLLFGLRYLELQKGLAALRRLQAQLARIITVTAQGVRAEERRDRELYDARKEECLRFSFGNNCSVEAEDMRYPADWLTAQVTAKLPSDLLDALHEAERDVQLSVNMSRAYRELSQKSVDGARSKELQR